MTAHRSELSALSLVTQRTYKPHTGYLDLLKTGPSGEVQNRTHAYDANGNLQGRSDPNQLFAESYTYDALDRLTDVTGLILSVQVDLEHYDYDTLGNITTKSGTDLSTGNPYSMAYDYDYDYDNGTGRPHAVKSVSDGSVTQLYSYDDDGLRERGTELSTLSIDYNRRHMPRTLSSTEDPAGISLYYDADGTRARKASPNAETLYLDDFYSRSAVPNTSGYSEWLVVSTGGHSVAEVVRESGGTPTTSYLHEDRLGSVEVVTDDSGAVLERRDCEAFGKRRSVTGPGAHTRGDFTGHELDAEFGLINMKARLYDPAIGRFVMPDPVIDQPWHSEGPNPYRYVRNNPINWIDPLGLETDCGDGACPPPPPPQEPPPDGGTCNGRCGWRAFKKFTGKVVNWDVWHPKRWTWDNAVADFFGFGDDGPAAHGIARNFDARTEVSTSAAPHSSSASPAYSGGGGVGADLGAIGTGATEPPRPEMITVQREVDGQLSWVEEPFDPGTIIASDPTSEERLNAIIPNPAEFFIGEGEARLAVGMVVDAAKLVKAERIIEAAGDARRVTTGFINDVVVVSRGKVIARGTVDVRATVEGIQSGKLSPRDIFKNREGLLPRQGPGYYQEFVHPTPGVSGVGPQRIVRGQGGELFYTPDHYKTFIPLN